MAGIMPGRTLLSIDGVYMPRTSDWNVVEDRGLEKAGENVRTVNGVLITLVLPGFDKYTLSWHCSGVRRHPAFDGLSIGRTATIVPIKEMEAAIMPGATTITLERDVSSIFKIRDDIDFTLLEGGGVDYSVVGRTVTLAHAWQHPITVQYRWTSSFKLDELDADWNEGPKEAGWNMKWREV